jgi:hypothetical protein
LGFKSRGRSLADGARYRVRAKLGTYASTAAHWPTTSAHVYPWRGQSRRAIVASASSARDSGAPAQGKDDDGRASWCGLLIPAETDSCWVVAQTPSATAEEYAMVAVCSKIAMLRPTSTLPRTTDARGGIAGEGAEVQASIDAYLGSAERMTGARGRGVEARRGNGCGIGVGLGAWCAAWRRSPAVARGLPL